MVSRWSVTTLLKSSGGTQVTWEAAADMFVYALYKTTVGEGVLALQGDESSDALVYAHCANPSKYGTNGTITIFAANPSTAAVSLQVKLPSSSSPQTMPSSSPQTMLNPSASSMHPRLEYVLTAPGDDVASRTPILNGDAKHPLKLGTDGLLPELQGKFYSIGARRRSGDDGTLTLPPLSQAFFVLLGASVDACKSAPVLVL